MAFNELVDKSPVGGITTSPALLVAANPARKFLLFFNASDVFMAYAPAGITPTVDVDGIGGVGSTVLAPGSGVILDEHPVPTNAFYGVSESGSGKNITVQEI